MMRTIRAFDGIVGVLGFSTRHLSSMFVVLCLAMVPAPLHAGIIVDVESVEHPRFSADSAHLALVDNALTLNFGRLVADQHHVSAVGLQCREFTFAGEYVECASGVLSVPGWLDDATFETRIGLYSRIVSATLKTSFGESLSVSLNTDGLLELRFTDWLVERVVQHIPAAAGYQPQAWLSGLVSVNLNQPEAFINIESSIRDGRFSSESGLQAGEGLAVSMVGTVNQSAESVWRFSGAMDWPQGEAYLHPFYLQAGARVELHGELRDQQLRVEQATLRMDGLGTLEARGTMDLSPFGVSTAEVVAHDVDLPVIGQRFLLPALAPELAGHLVFEGRAQASLNLRNGELHAFDLSLADVSLRMEEGRFELGPVNASLPWRRAAASRLNVDVAGARWESIGLGPFVLNADISDSSMHVNFLAIPVLDGRLLMSDLSLALRNDGVHGSGSLVLEPISVQALTTALGLPSMTGVLSAALPRLSLSPGSLVLDGSLIVSLFDGYLRIDSLEIREPFGLASYLSADIRATHLDLGQITNTFAFGSISGFVDAEILGLELVRWRPVAFDAQVVSSPGRYSRRISQRAVQNIGALSGAGAAVALQRGVLGFFDSFGYRELGLSCRLVNNECQMGGVEDLQGAAGGDGGFVIVRGGGIPSLNVIGYNRRVNWQDLLDRLQAAIESNEAPRID